MDKKMYFEVWIVSFVLLGSSVLLRVVVDTFFAYVLPKEMPPLVPSVQFKLLYYGCRFAGLLAFAAQAVAVMHFNASHHAMAALSIYNFIESVWPWSATRNFQENVVLAGMAPVFTAAAVASTPGAIVSLSVAALSGIISDGVVYIRPVSNFLMHVHRRVRSF